MTTLSEMEQSVAAKFASDYDSWYVVWGNRVLICCFLLSIPVHLIYSPVPAARVVFNHLLWVFIMSAFAFYIRVIGKLQRIIDSAERGKAKAQDDAPAHRDALGIGEGAKE